MSTSPRAAVLRDPNFTWLIGGGVISALGDQFTMIALPWLVLQLSHDARTLGLVVALMAIPRAVLILLGGAVVDRYSPKNVLMLTKHINTVLLGVLSALVYRGNASLPVVIALALGLSLASAFSIPAGTSMLPHAVQAAQLQAANGIMMAVRQVTMLLGPLLAGLLFALAGDGSRGPQDMHGLALAFGFDCLSFAVSAWTLAKVETHPVPAAPGEPVLRAVGEGLLVVWRDLTLRTCFTYWGLCACVTGGLIQVALPLLAGTRLAGASALGLLMGMQGAGMLAGMVLSGVLGRKRLGNLGLTLLAIDGAVGALVPLLGLVTSTWQGMLVMFAVGVLAGYVQVAVFTWIQQRVPRNMLGRMMSIFMFVFMGLAPLAAAVAGWLASWLSLPVLFGAAGAFLAGAALLAWLFTPLRSLTDASLPAAPTN